MEMQKRDYQVIVIDLKFPKRERRLENILEQETNSWMNRTNPLSPLNPSNPASPLYRS